MNRLVLLIFTIIFITGCPAQAGEDSQKIQQAQKVLESDYQNRKLQAEKELAAVLKKYRLKLAVSVLITESGNQPRLNLVPDN